MHSFRRKALATVGLTAAAVAATSVIASPAQAYTSGLAKVVGSSTVQFNALMGKSNNLVITISGRTVTLNDTVALTAGKGCKAVKGDKTKVKCTTKKKTTKITAALGDKNDKITNKTGVYLFADGGSGNDVLIGGSAGEQLQGGTGNDKIWGNGGNDTLFGGSGNDLIKGGAGDDKIDAGAGTDTVYGEAGKDEVHAGAGNDVVYGGAGNDFLLGEAGNDNLKGEAGDDELQGGAGNDKLYAGAGADWAIGQAGDDLIYGDAGEDVLIGGDLDSSGNHTGSTTARDRLDGGSQADVCLVRAAGTAVNCEDLRKNAVDAADLATLRG
ncbi:MULTISPECIES: calcium-binding protein [Actinoplanes]|uniref:calcium-binding protein n=1 Tax=Actinoplanes TaxID=1865 RepID=UPI000695FDE3|nr:MULTISPECIES: calcium-binding protein [Actinoplanes]GLY07178.1 hypothetical protein Acsp01_75570 [Actinoplanes sp. NBRC 101535]